MLAISIAGRVYQLTWVVALSAASFVAGQIALRRLNATATRAKDVQVASTLGFMAGRWCRRLQRK